MCPLCTTAAALMPRVEAWALFYPEGRPRPGVVLVWAVVGFAPLQTNALAGVERGDGGRASVAVRLVALP